MDSLSSGMGERKRRYRDSGLSRSQAARSACLSSGAIGRMRTSDPSRSGIVRALRPTIAAGL